MSKVIVGEIEGPSTTSNKITIFESLSLLILLLLFAFLILLQFNLNAVVIGLVSTPLIVLYPFLKRYTYWPQLGLGIIFNWGILIVSFQFTGKLFYNYLFLYIACIFWTLAYDTIYAYQDRKDDLKNNIKSTAILFGTLGHKFVIMFYTIFFLIIGFLGYKSSVNLLSFATIFLFIFAMILYLNKWRLD